MKTLSFQQALTEAMAEEMERDDRVFLMGQEVRSGAYGPTRGLLDRFGPQRVRDTPISEAACVGAAIGAALTGMRPICDITIASFVYISMDQLVSHAAKIRYMYGGQAHVPAVFRATMYYGVGAAAQHSDRPYGLFMAIPGLKVAVPTNPHDAKGLLKAAIRDDDPVMFFEDSTLYSSRGQVPEGDYVVPLGQAKVTRQGIDATVVAIAGSHRHALTAADMLSQEGIEVEVIDPRTLVPLDVPAILASVAKTGRLVVVDPAHLNCSAASEIAATVAEQAFDKLRAPIMRVTTPQTHVPHSPALEKLLYPTRDRIVAAVKSTLGAGIA